MKALREGQQLIEYLKLLGRRRGLDRRQLGRLVDEALPTLRRGGAVRAGATALPVNIRLKPEEMRFILGDAAPVVAVIHEKVWATASQAIEDDLRVIGIG